MKIFLIVLSSLVISSCSIFEADEYLYISGAFICKQLDKDKDSGLPELSRCTTLNSSLSENVTIMNPTNILKIKNPGV